jgi:transcriptional regulator with XRE-family HTH domain
MNFFLARRQELGKKAGRKLSQYHFALKLQVTPSAVGSWERGEVAPSLQDAEKLAAAYEVTYERIERAIVELNREIATRRAAAPATAAS